ncbi:MAG: Ig-like domain-containing protein [Bacteroidales bacterium]|nr:Ig-like domain-containing protein [Bacteroidales bacterium]
MKKNKTKTIIIFSHLIVYICVIILFSNCAHISSPTGGPKDTKPPMVVSYHPNNYSTNFTPQKVSVEFDEFIVLKDVNNQVIISPPLKEKPDFKIRGKSIVFNLDEELLENTTYTIFFGDAINDNHEGNILPNFEYVFSTGNTLDSLSVVGEVLNSFTLQPEEGVYIMLYEDFSDSVPLKERPLFLSKTTKNGKFFVNNLKNKKFKIFALRDNNNNYIYDLPNEQIAFSDTLISPEYIEIIKHDTLNADSLATENVEFDSIFMDTIIQHYAHLYLFEEIDSIQKVENATLLKKDKIEFVFRFPTTNAEIKPLNHDFDKNWKIEELSPQKDTLIIWLNNVDVDTIFFEVSDDGQIIDTNRIVLKKKEKEKRRKKKEEESEKIIITSNVQNSFLELNRHCELWFPYPLKNYDFNEIIIQEDSIQITAEFIFPDSVKRNVFVDFDWKEESKYSILIPDSIFTDIQNLSNDTTIFDFKTKKMSDYGTLLLDITISDSCSQFIIQLLNDKENILREKIITKSELLKFEYLKAKSYRIKAIKDSNRNFRWDNGDYLKKIQPEKVYYFPKSIQIRANWDIEEEWKL